MIEYKITPMKDPLLMEWSACFETLLLSTLSHPDSARSILIYRDGAIPLDHYLNLNKHFLTPWGAIGFYELPPNYFNFQDTMNYQILLEKDLLK